MVESELATMARCLLGNFQWHGGKVATEKVLCIVPLFGVQCALEHFATLLVLAHLR